MTGPKKRPIIFQGESVQAILDGRKSATRRALDRVNGLGPVTEFKRTTTPGYDFIMRDKRRNWNDLREPDLLTRCPYGAPGENVWVREACWLYGEWFTRGRTPTGRTAWTFKAQKSKGALFEKPGMDAVAFQGGGPGWSWRPSIHMPRWASRLTLRVESVRVERLQEITEQDAWAEGAEEGPDIVSIGGEDTYRSTHRGGFKRLWQSINGKKHPWESNPWVWVVAFERVET